MEPLLNTIGISVPSTKILTFVLAITMKGSCILMAVFLLTKLLRRVSSATRHLIWGMTLVGILVLPAFNLLLPAWDLYLPGPLSPILPQNRETSGNYASISEDPHSKTHTTTQVTFTEERLKRNAPFEPPPPSMKNQNVILDLIPTIKTHGTIILISLWIMGMAVVFLRQLLGKILIWRIASRAQRVTASDWLQLTALLKKRCGLRRQVRLIKSEKSTLPMTWGLLRPTILLPTEADTWSEEHRRFVLLHEFAHVKRWDCMMQLFAQLAVVIYWFNPLVWLAHRQFLKEREHACDDAVLESGSVPSEYAGLLLEIAQSLPRLQLTSLATVSMARRSQLEGRLLAILDPRIRRRALNRLAVLLTGLVVFSFVLPLAAIYPVAIVEAPEKSEQQTDTNNEENIRSESGIPDSKSEAGVTEDTAVKASDTETPESPPNVEQKNQQRKTTTAENPQEIAKGQTDEAQVIHSLSQVLRDPSLEVRIQAAETMGKMDNPTAVGPLISALNDENREMRAAVARALGDLEDKTAVDALVETLKDADWQVRQAAAEALGNIEDARAVEPLGKALSDENRNVRITIVQALEDIGDRSGVEPLVGALNDEDWLIRREAADALGTLEDPAAIGPLSNILNDSNWEVRKAVVEALGDIDDTRAITPLGRAIKDPNWEIRLAAAEALGDIDDPSVMKPLCAAIHDKHREVLKTVIETLGETENPKSIPCLMPFLKDTRWEIRATTAAALGEIKDPGPVPELSQYLKDENREVRLKVTQALGDIEDHRAVDGLIDALNDEDCEIRKMAAWALGEIGDPKALEPLSEKLKDENEAVRLEAAKALGEIR
jgi:HEAT repeat protein/beta-lactamase regulating signal transducer with metallopeptidase domain